MKKKKTLPDPLVEIHGKIEHLHDCIEQRTAKLDARLDQTNALVAENTAITKEGAELVKQVKEILTAFKVTGAFAKWAAKWITIIGGAVASYYAALKAFK